MLHKLLVQLSILHNRLLPGLQLRGSFPLPLLPDLALAKPVELERVFWGQHVGLFAQAGPHAAGAPADVIIRLGQIRTVFLQAAVYAAIAIIGMFLAFVEVATICGGIVAHLSVDLFHGWNLLNGRGLV